MTLVRTHEIREGRLCAGMTANSQAATPVIHSKLVSTKPGSG